VIATAFLVGLAAAGLAQVARALAPLSILTRKPVSCDLCMSWWGALLATAVTRPWPLTWREVALAGVVVLAGVAVSLLVLKTTTKLRDVAE